MHWQGFFKGTYITGAEFGDRILVATINRVESVDLEGEDGRVKARMVVWFSDLDRGWVLCKTNAMCVAAMFGDETDNWTGKRVVLYATQVKVGADTKIGIRVKGSPDIQRPVTVKIKLPRKKAFDMIMRPTEKSPAPKANTAPPPQPQPSPVSEPPARDKPAPQTDSAALMDRLREW